MKLHTIFSGGQTGADRGALDAALMLEGHLKHGGHCPRGRKAEDGPIPDKYQLTEIDGGYPERTVRNVQGSDGTLIIALKPMGTGSWLTLRTCEKLGKPVWTCVYDPRGEHYYNNAIAHRDVNAAADWCLEHEIGTLNVAGTRESSAPGISVYVRRFVIDLYQRVCLLQAEAVRWENP